MQEGKSTFHHSEELLLSIVVPVYNVDHYLEECLQSIISQTLPPKNFEVILVDDKSTDNSLSICKKFCNEYTNFKLIELPENTPGGAGIPSNRGIDVIRGRYLGFVDSDDYVVPTMFETLLNEALATNSDVAVCSYFSQFDQRGKTVLPADHKQVKKLAEEYKNLSVREIKRKVLCLSPSPWKKIYKKAFLDKYHIRYPEGDFFYEDGPLHWFTTVLADSFSFVSEPLVIHRMEREGQTSSYKPEKLLALNDHLQTIANFLKKEELWDEYKIDFIRYATDQFYWASQMLGDKQKVYVKTFKKHLAGVTLSDLSECRRIYHQRRAVFLNNVCLIHGYYRLGSRIKHLLLNRHRLVKK